MSLWTLIVFFRRKVDCFLINVFFCCRFRKFSVQKLQNTRTFYGINQIDFSFVIKLVHISIHSTQNSCLEQLCSRWSHLIINSETHSDQVMHLLGICWWNWIIIANNDFSVQRWEISSLERMSQFAHFIKKTSGWPNVTLWSVLFSFPDLWTCIIWCSCLSWTHSLFSYFWHIEIS